MFRFCAFLCSLLIAALTISTAGLAADLGDLRFTLQDRGNGRVQVGFDLDRQDGRNHDRWNNSTTMPARDLNGLAPGDLIAGGRRPLQFALLREAGRIDCAGIGGGGRGAGRCRLTPDQGFLGLLAQAGIRTPDARDTFGMVLLDVRRDLVLAVRDAHYRGATAGDLTGLAALEVTPAYIRELAARGYRPDSLHDLTAFKALGVTPAYVDGLSRAGFGRIAPDAIVQMKALGITAEYLAELRAAGYAPLKGDEVVQMKALGITAADYARFRQAHGRVAIAQLVQAKVLGFVDAPGRYGRR